MTAKDSKLFVWDFHGTLEIGNDLAVIEITNHILEKEGYKHRLTESIAAFLAGKSWHEYFMHLMPDLDYNESVELQKKCVSVSQKNPDIIAKHIKLSPNAAEVLDKIHNSDHTQIVVSNTQPKSLDIFLKSVGIEHYFPEHHRKGIDTDNSDKRMTKKEWLNEFLEDKQFPGGVVAIGDSPWDVELAELHPKGVGYLYSHQGRPHREHPKANKINDLIHILEELFS